MQDSSGRSGTGETPQALRAEEAHRPPRGSLSILERKSTSPHSLFFNHKIIKKQQSLARGNFKKELPLIRVALSRIHSTRRSACLAIPLKGLAPRFQHYSMFNYPINQNK